MATPLDIGLFQHFGGMWPFLLVLVLVYAVLTKTVWPEKKGLSAVVAFLLGFVTLMSPIATKTINKMAPWFVIFVVFGLLMILAFNSFGVSPDHISKLLVSKNYGSQLYLWVLAIMLIIGIGSLISTINEEQPIVDLQAGDNLTTQEIPVEDDSGFFPTLFNPKVLGMVLILLVSFFTIRELTKM